MSWLAPIRAANMMIECGGGFAEALGYAYMAGDQDNREKIQSAFPELFQRYEQMDRDMRKYEVAIAAAKAKVMA